MKSISSVLLATFFFSVTTLGASFSSSSNNDRIEFEDGPTGITHSENFEYVCDLLVPEISATGRPTIYLESKAWIDLDYEGGPTQYRLAFGFPEGGTISITAPDGSTQVLLGAEMAITSVNQDGRLITEVAPNTPPVTVELKMNRSGSVVGIEGLSDDNKVVYSGNCKLNEVD